jgi:hypothetical protein
LGFGILDCGLKNNVKVASGLWSLAAGFWQLVKDFSQQRVARSQRL